MAVIVRKTIDPKRPWPEDAEEAAPKRRADWPALLEKTLPRDVARGALANGWTLAGGDPDDVAAVTGT